MTQSMNNLEKDQDGLAPVEEFPVEWHGEIAVVQMTLEKLDMSNFAEFKRRFAPTLEKAKRIVINLEHVNFVDSSGLGALLSVLRDLNASGGDLKLCSVQRRVRVMFELVRMHRVLSIFETPEEAIASFTA